MQVGQVLVRWGPGGDNVRLRQAPPQLHDKVAASSASYEVHKVSGSQRTPHVALSICTRSCALTLEMSSNAGSWSVSLTLLKLSAPLL